MSRHRTTLYLGGFIGFAFALFVYAITLSGQPVVPKSSYKIDVTVPSAIALAPHSDVRRAGVKIGAVTSVRAEGAHAVVRLALDKEHAPVFQDARVLVRGKTLIGENYVDLDPGRPAAGPVPEGGSLPISRAPESTQLDQFLATFDAKRRRSVQRILDVLGGGLRNRGKDVNRFLDAGGDTITASRPVFATLAADRAEVTSLIDDFGRVMRAIGDRGDGIRMFARRGSALARTLAARDESLRRTLAALPPLLRQTRTTSARLGRFSSSATPVMRDLRRSTEQLAPAVAELRPTAEITRRAIRQLGRFSRESIPLAAKLRPFARGATGLAPALERTLRELNPLIAYLKPHLPELGSIFGGLRGATEIYDAIGHYTRVGLVITKSGPVGILPPEQENALQALFDAGILKDADTRGYNAYPAPGSLVEPKPASGGYARVEADPPYRRRGG
jgi:phospholipid/cholesterol/gamma-HCH transport system substrate-binding protein